MTPRIPLSPTRRLLARMRVVMAGTAPAPERLADIVRIIAGEMVVEVCSVYVRRAGDVLELFETQGLRAEAVHRTRLRLGEGLVGEIAARAHSLNLADAQSHPAFAFRPETGEEIYSSFLGAPILRGGRVVGVVAVQNRVPRTYSDDEVETLQTVAMVLAELIEGGALINRSELLPADGTGVLPLRLEGVSLNRGQALGVAVLHEPQFGIRQLVADNPEVEQQRLRRAVAELHGSLDALMDDAVLARGGEQRDVLDAFRMIAEDAGWLRRMSEAVADGLTAEAAVHKVHDDIRARLVQVSDPVLREKVHDLEDLTARLLRHLGIPAANAANGRGTPDNAVLIARAMGPAQLLEYDRARLKALVLEEGSASSHVAIVARALDIPVVGQVTDAVLRVEPGDPVLVDGDAGWVYVRPGEEVQQAFDESAAIRAQRRAALGALRDQPAVTRDGQRVRLDINAGLPGDVAGLAAVGADGVGLFRTEIAFMARPTFPTTAEQTQLYTDILDQAADQPVAFRTLDLGSDKALPYWRGPAEENPAMGWRALRVSLDRPAMMRQQLRALIRAAAGRGLRIMFPMVTDVAEYKRARALVNVEMDRARRSGAPMPADLRVGAMLEVPALAFQLPLLLEHVDFLSVGSNDLLQFLFATDRGNPRLGGRYDPLSPLVLSYLRQVVARCAAASVPLCLCGEMAGRPLEALALVAVGFRHLSMSPAAVGPVKAMIGSLSVDAASAYMDTLYDLPHRSVRGKLRAFAMDHGVLI